MDGQRFDHLLRVLALGGSRRRVVQGLAGGFLAGLAGRRAIGRVRAQQSVPIGGRCSAFGANSECSQANTPVGGIPVICSDNGIARDGQFNCCRNAGGACTADFNCCGAALCINGLCGGGGGTTPGGLLALGAECTSTTQCNQAGGSVVCADNGIPADGALNCCRNQGGTCSIPSNCCGSLDCAGGVCGGGSSSNLAPGAACTTATQCSQAGGAVVCADNGLAGDGGLNCCRNEGGGCTSGAGCCGGLNCTGGVCTAAAATGGGLQPGAACTTTEQCSQTGGAVSCADNGLAGDGGLNCCRYEGGACAGGGGCCGGLECVGGVCTGGTTPSTGGGLQPGATCTSTEQCSQDGGATYCADNGLPGDGGLNCCRYEGGACAGGGGCCGGLECVGGVCTAGTASVGQAPSPA